MLIMLTELQFKMIHHFAGMYLFCDFLYYSFCTLSYNKTQIVQERKKYVQRLNIQRCRKDSNTSKAKNSEYNFFSFLLHSSVWLPFVHCTSDGPYETLTKLTCTSDETHMYGPYETHMYGPYETHMYKWRPLRNSRVFSMMRRRADIWSIVERFGMKPACCGRL